jgi:putative transposase
MARKLRMIVPGLPVHVVQRGVNKCDIFANDKDRISYLDFLIEASDKHDCPIHCYVLMGNHVHLMMTPPDKDSIKATMHALNTRYVWHFNKRHERTGPLWEGRYRTSVIDNDAYLKVCYQYIELNPVRAKFCQQPADYDWSSHRHHAYGESDRIVSQHRGYTMLGKTDEQRQKRYQGWFRQQPSDAELTEIRTGI